MQTRQKIVKKRIWLVGASQGIGLELVKKWLKAGYCVVASARQAEQSEALEALKAQYTDQLRCLDIDVSKQEECAQKVEQAWAFFNGIDLWFYNVGAYQHMPSEQWNWDSFVAMNQANYLGAVALMLPLHTRFQEQGGGHWVWNASLAAYFGLPYGGGYSAPKAALVNLAESLQPELKQQSIRLQIINHGFVRTRLTAKNPFDMPGLLEPEQAAQSIFNGVEAASNRFEIRFPFSLRLILSVLKCVPYRLSLGLTKKIVRKSNDS